MFYLRELEKKDLPVINKWRNNPELIELLGAPFRYINLDVDVRWYESYMNNRGNAVRCAITEDEEDVILGLISLVSIDYMNQSAELHIMIGDSKNQGRGLGTFAVTSMLNHAFNNMNLQRIELSVLEDNIRAKHLYEKCGFVYEGKKRKAKYKNGTFVDMLIYSILKSEFCGGGIAHKLSTFVVLDASSLSEKHYVLGVCDDAFKESIIQRDIYFDLLKKIHQKGKFIYAHNGKVLGYCAFYANDLEKRNAYISLIAVRPEYQRMQVGVKLLNASFEEMRNCGMKQCLLEVRKNNLRAIRFYKINQFVILEERKESYIMKCDL